MGIVISKTVVNGQQNKNSTETLKPPVEGAVRLTALEMNGLHFGSDKTTPLSTSTNKA